MKITAIIPARLNSTRLPEKLLKDVSGKPLIIRTYESAIGSQLFNDVVVVTNNKLIENELIRYSVNYIFKDKEYETGTDRIADVSSEIDSEIIINIQGDEPFINTKTLKLIIDKFSTDESNKINVISVMTSLFKKNEIENLNNVKVVVDNQENAIYFSRHPIPFIRDHSTVDFYKHVGVYAFRKSFLMKFSKYKIGPLEKAEKIEALRMLENGIDIKMIKSTENFVGVDTIEDLEKARRIYNEKNII